MNNIVSIEKSNEELVTITVIAYNSSDTIVETLNSIFNQTYTNIELVVSDDCSKDNTVEVCNKWIEDHKDRFANVQLLTKLQNEGTGANINSAISSANGNWIKSIAADDILLPNCVSDYMNYVLDNPDSNIIFAKCKSFNEKGLTGQIQYLERLNCFNLPIDKQLIEMYRQSFVPTTTMFIRTQFACMHPFPSKYGILEDYPYWISLLEQGIKFHFIDKITVYYRIHTSASRMQGAFVNERFFNVLKWHFYDNIYPKVYKDHPEIVDYHSKQFLVGDFQLCVLKNKVNFMTKVANKIFNYFIYK